MLENIGIVQQLEKWLKTEIVLVPFDIVHAKRNSFTLQMLFGVPKHAGSTGSFLTFLMKQ